MDCPICRKAVLWVRSQGLTVPARGMTVSIYKRAEIIAAQWVPIREATYNSLAGYISGHPAGRQYGGYWQANEIQQADEQVSKP